MPTFIKVEDKKGWIHFKNVNDIRDVMPDGDGGYKVAITDNDGDGFNWYFVSEEDIANPCLLTTISMNVKREDLR